MSDIKELFLFNGITNEDINDIISTFDKKTFYKKGSLIYSSVKFAKAIGYIIKGSAYAVANNDNGVFLKRFTAGMCFGAAAVFGSNQSYVSTVIAETDVEIIFITEEKLKDIFFKYPITSFNYISFLSDKIRFLNSKLSVISCSSAEDTVYKYLISATDKYGYALLPKTMSLFSQMLGLGRASLYRSLDALENSGKIVRENNKIKVIIK